MLLADGSLHAMYYIFLRNEPMASDSELLKVLGFSEYVLAGTNLKRGRYVIFADDASWEMIADDLSYTLWNKQTNRQIIEELSKNRELFACSVGDSDSSFDFEYYQEGLLRRKYVVTDPDYKGGSILENIGDPLPGEAEAFKEKDELNRVLHIAKSLGIKINYTEKDIRVYALVENSAL